MRHITKSLSFKITLVVVVVELLVFIGVGIYYTRRFSQEIDRRINAQIAIPGALMSRGEMSFSAVSDRRTMEGLIHEPYVEGMVVGLDGIVYYASEPGRMDRPVEGIDGRVLSRISARSVDDDMIYPLNTGAGRFLICLTPLQADGKQVGYLYLKVGTEQSEAEKRSVAMLFAIGSLGSILITSPLLIMLLHWMFIKRLTSLVDLFRRFSQGDYAARSSAGVEGDEIVTLMRGFDALAGRLQETMVHLSESESRFRVLVEHAPEAILVYDCDEKRFVEANPNAERLFACSHEKLLQLCPQSFYLPAQPDELPVDQSVMEHSRRALSGEEVVFERAIRNAAGEESMCEVRLVRLSSGNRKLLRASFIDIAERKKFERALLLAKEAAETASRAKDQFIAVLSHELRTPLTPVLAEVDLLQRNEALTPELRSSLKMIHRNVELETRLIADLLDMTKIVRGELRLECEPCSAHACLLDALGICQVQIEEKHHRIELHLEAAKHHIHADAVRLRQIFWNLLGNAIKYTPEGGVIEVTTRNNEADQFELTIRDNGIGIEPEILGRLFEPFVQGEQNLSRRYGGLGLGLSIAKGLVEAHQGKLSVTSMGRNQGATFVAQFPLQAASAAKPRVSESSRTLHCRPLRILLVEDNQDTVRVMTQLLRLSKHEVSTAGTVQSAMEMAKTGEYDLMLCDIGLPDGTGWELMEHLSLTHPIKALALSGFVSEEDIRRSKKAGFIEHLSKPISPSVLERIIAQVMV